MTAKKSDKPKAISFRGKRFRLPELEGGGMDIDTLEAFEDGKAITALRGLFGPTQWAQFKSLDPKPTVDDLNEIAEKVAKVYGMGSVGESDASSD